MHENSSDSFIKEMVQVYDKVFFNNACFSEILDKIDNGHIHHFSANGTDFSNGFAFRFQASRKIVNTDPKFNRGIIGNKEHRLSWDIAKKIKLSEILAVSSCFPAGFEPMFFPSDFEISKDKTLQDSLESIKVELNGEIIFSDVINFFFDFIKNEGKYVVESSCVNLVTTEKKHIICLNKAKPNEDLQISLDYTENLGETIEDYSLEKASEKDAEEANKKREEILNNIN